MAAVRIVVLDGHPLGGDDLDWGPLASLGRLELHPRTTPEQVWPRARGASVVITNKVVLDAAQLEALYAEGLRYVGISATGTNVVDVARASALGIVVENVPAYATDSVAQWVMTAVLDHFGAFGAHASAARSGAWSASPDFSLRVAPLTELRGLVFGLVGLGAIGRRVAELAHAFGCEVLASTTQASRPELAVPVRWLPLGALLQAADVVSLHCPLTPRTERLLGRAELALMRPSALLVNAGRGGLIDEAALAEALALGKLGGAALDVLSVEPPPPDHPLLHAPRCTVTPHVAWATQQARRRLLEAVASRLRAFLGAP